MFRKHNPNYKILENIHQCGLPNFREGKILGGGGSDITHAEPQNTLLQTHQTELGVQESQKSILLRTLQGNSTASPFRWRDHTSQASKSVLPENNDKLALTDR